LTKGPNLRQSILARRCERHHSIEEISVGARVVGTLPFGGLLVVLALAVASLLVSYAIVAEWPDRGSAGVPPGAVRPAN
jgi:hypothetical protein